MTSIAACTAVPLLVMNNSPLSWLTITLTFSCSFIVDLCPGDMGYHSLAANPKFRIVCACVFMFTCMHIWHVIQPDILVKLTMPGQCAWLFYIKGKSWKGNVLLSLHCWFFWIMNVKGLAS